MCLSEDRREAPAATVTGKLSGQRPRSSKVKSSPGKTVYAFAGDAPLKTGGFAFGFSGTANKKGDQGQERPDLTDGDRRSEAPELHASSDDFEAPSGSRGDR